MDSRDETWFCSQWPTVQQALDYAKGKGDDPGQQLDPRSPILGWLIENVGTLYTLFSFDEKARDGLTAFRRIKGRDWTVALPAFGECVDFRVKTNHKLEPRWESGFFLGVRLHTTEKIIGTPKGVVVQSVRRKPDDQQWNLQLLQSVTGTPWAPNPAKQKEPREALELPEPVSIEPEQPEEEVKQVETSELKPHFRRVYLRQDDFDKFGYSAGCKACTLIRSGLDRQEVNHAEDCRLRIVQRLQETEYGRKRIGIAAKREEEAKQDASKRQRLAIQDVERERASGPSSGSGIKRPAEDPPQDPRLETPEQPGGSVGSTRQPGTKRDVEQAGLSSDPMEDVETFLANVLLSQRQCFLGAVYARAEQSPETLPVCEEHFEIDPEEPLYWDNVSGKPLDTAKVQVQEAGREECQVIDAMGVWEVIDRPTNERVISIYIYMHIILDYWITLEVQRYAFTSFCFRQMVWSMGFCPGVTQTREWQVRGRRILSHLLSRILEDADCRDAGRAPFARQSSSCFGSPDPRSVSFAAHTSSSHVGAIASSHVMPSIILLRHYFLLKKDGAQLLESFCSPQLCVGFLFLILYPASLTHTIISHTRT